MESRAYVMLETAMGECLQVCGALRRCDWVESVERTTGAFDVIVRAQGRADREIEDIIGDGIGPIGGILRVVICPISTVASVLATHEHEDESSRRERPRKWQQEAGGMMEYLRYVCARCMHEQVEPGTCPDCGLPLVPLCPVCDSPIIGEDACPVELER